MRRLAPLTVLLACALPAFAEDTATVVAALSSKQAAARYMQQLCTNVERAERQYFEAMDSYAQCAQILCAELSQRDSWETATGIVRRNLVGDYTNAAQVYRAKHNAA